jgi:hypothetical protein
MHKAASFLLNFGLSFFHARFQELAFKKLLLIQTDPHAPLLGNIRRPRLAVKTGVLTTAERGHRPTRLLDLFSPAGFSSLLCLSARNVPLRSHG